MKSTIYALLIALVVCSLLFVAPVVAQVERQNKMDREMFEAPKFLFDTFTYASDTATLSKVVFYLQIQYAGLKFVKSDEKGFTASYEGQLSFFDSTNALVYEKHWNGEVDTKVYEQTVSPKTFSTYVQDFTLTPHHYNVTILIRDLETRKLFRQEKQVAVPLYAQNSLNISDVMMLDDSRRAEGNGAMFPAVARVFLNTSTDTKLYFEAYSPNDGQESHFIYRIVSSKGEEMGRDTLTQMLTKGTNKMYFPVKNLNYTMGDYTLELSASAKDTAMRTGEKKSVKFAIRWEGMAVNITDITEAVSQLVYMAKTEELDSLQDKTINEDERRERFMKFWKKRDPSPNTARNELMEEYYHRVAESNKEFGTHSAGWRTDRGMVYIIFGAPDNIERHPFDLDSKPYEMWYYYESNRKFTFIDETGFGDFRLTTPLYEVWGNGKR